MTSVDVGSNKGDDGEDESSPITGVDGVLFRDGKNVPFRSSMTSRMTDEQKDALNRWKLVQYRVITGKGSR